MIECYNKYVAEGGDCTKKLKPHTNSWKGNIMPEQQTEFDFNVDDGRQLELDLPPPRQLKPPLPEPTTLATDECTCASCTQ